MKPEEVTKEPMKPEEVSKEPAVPGEVSKKPMKPEEVTKEPMKPEEVSKEPMKPEEVSKEPMKPEEVSKEPAVPAEVSKEPMKPEEVTKEPAVPGEVPVPLEGGTRRPTVPGGGTSKVSTKSTTTHTRGTLNAGGLSIESALSTVPGQPTVSTDSDGDKTVTDETTTKSPQTTKVDDISGKVPTGFSIEPIAPSDSEETDNVMITHYSTTTTPPMYDNTNSRPRSRRPVRPFKSARYGNAKNMKRRKIKKMTSSAP